MVSLAVSPATLMVSVVSAVSVTMGGAVVMVPAAVVSSAGGPASFEPQDARTSRAAAIRDFDMGTPGSGVKCLNVFRRYSVS
jgi:hypothetical protein